MATWHVSCPLLQLSIQSGHACAAAHHSGATAVLPALHAPRTRLQLGPLGRVTGVAAARRRAVAVPAAADGRSLEFATAPQPGRSGIASATAAGVLGFRERLAGLGLAGVVAYGLLNTLYYTAAFYFVWTYVARVPRGLGVAATAAKFAEVIGLTWAGSQVTKVPRAAGAVVLAPAVDLLLTTLQRRAGLRSKRAAFWVVLVGCITLAVAFYGTMLLAWS